MSLELGKENTITRTEISKLEQTLFQSCPIPFLYRDRLSRNLGERVTFGGGGKSYFRTAYPEHRSRAALERFPWSRCHRFAKTDALDKVFLLQPRQVLSALAAATVATTAFTTPPALIVRRIDMR